MELNIKIMIDTESIIQEFDRFILRFGGNYRNFYIGITDNPVSRLNFDHNIGQANPYLFMEAANNETARMIERYFLDQGCDGGGDEGSGFVYAYKKGPRTRP